MTRSVGILAWILAIAGAAVVLFSFLLPLFGWTPLTVVGHSMTPALADGALVIVAPVPAESLHTGAVITYAYKGRLLTHRVVRVLAGPDPTFITRGDANGRDDGAPVSASQVVGRVIYAVPALGYGYTHLGAAMNVVLLLPIALMLGLMAMRSLDLGRPGPPGKLQRAG